MVPVGKLCAIHDTCFPMDGSFFRSSVVLLGQPIAVLECNPIISDVPEMTNVEQDVHAEFLIWFH